MPQSEALFDALKKHYANNLPFVVYSRPINTIIKAWMQHTDAMNVTHTFTESGFVFAPFDLAQSAVLLPENQSDYHEIQTGLDFEFEASQIEDVEEDFKEKKDHTQLVSKAIKAIESDELKKVVLSRVEVKSEVNDNPIDIFKRLYYKYKNAMVYCWFHPKVGLWLGATPELLFKVEGQQLTTISLAGTQPFQPNENPKWTSKEVEEQQIVTDYLAHQLQPYTIKTNIAEVETIRAGDLLHLKTRLISRIASDANLKAIIETLHPTPAVCGFPKEAAKAFIMDNENYDRQYYTGFLGELNLKMIVSRNSNIRNVENNAYRTVKKQSNFYVNLRCMQLRNSQAMIYVGGGITKDSFPEKEWQETCNKTKTIRAVLS